MLITAKFTSETSETSAAPAFATWAALNDRFREIKPYTMQRPTEDRFLITLPELKERMVILLAGCSAEEIVFGEISTGASDDLAKVTDIARECVTRYGTSETVGQVVLEEKTQRFLGEGSSGLGLGQRDFSDDSARKVNLAMRDLVAQAYQEARKVLTEKRETLAEGAALLLERETLTPKDFEPLARVPR